MGRRLRAVRERAGMSQVEFAQALGTSRNTLINWEKDESEPPVDVLRTIRMRFDVCPEWLMMGEDLKPRRHLRMQDWATYDAIEKRLTAMCLKARLGLPPEQLTTIARIIYEEGTEVECFEKGQLMKALRVIALER